MDEQGSPKDSAAQYLFSYLQGFFSGEKLSNEDLLLKCNPQRLAPKILYLYLSTWCYSYSETRMEWIPNEEIM